MVDRPDTNPYGDVELTPRGMRALAHPVRLAILSRLQGFGPSTATALAPLVGATPSVTSWHLRHLAEHGLVRDADADVDADVMGDGRQRWWQAAGTGFRFTPSSDEAGRDAATLLSHVLFDQAQDLPRVWVRDTEPLLEDDWRRSAGLSNTTFLATADELAEVEAAIEELLAPYVRRRADRRADGTNTPGARNVRMLRYVLPEADPGSMEESS
ncbi:Helix-turn-helix domain-containing protein [Pedococcus dokdonensis]|uniref:Helix-turn-helix domain-containing protein n=1 Tax=Pedococcus dokdonensis TaxID=443156 RepID=A0A1H0Q4X3_9MICO|nr:helix-turn-helix domain-containing protein [Pedococcus dokdonensis]SDP11659.1 Helix-turn-helix domain-containing protein [Pedococcus dokdonensis]